MLTGNISRQSAAATFFVGEPAVYEFSDGLFFITYTLGETPVRICMLPSCFFKASARVDAAKREFTGRTCDLHLVEAAG